MLRAEFDALRAGARPRRADPRQSRRPSKERAERRARSPNGGAGMTTFTVAVVSAGLSQPSSTRLLADRLARATQRAAAARDPPRRVRGHRTPRAGQGHHGQPAHRVPEREAPPGPRRDDERRRRDRGDARVQRLLQRAVQVVLRRGRPAVAGRQAGADRRDRRFRPALAGARPRDAAAFLVPAARSSCRPGSSPRRPISAPPTAAVPCPIASMRRAPSWCRCSLRQLPCLLMIPTPAVRVCPPRRRHARGAHPRRSRAVGSATPIRSTR